MTSVSTIGGGGDTTIPSPGRSKKQPLPGIGLRHPTWSASLLRIQLISPGGWSNISPVGDLFVPSPPKTGTKFLHPLPPSIVERVFPTGVIEIRKYSDEELKTMLDETREASKQSRKLGRVMGIVAAHRLKKIREFLAYQELATWRRMNGFDRVVEGEKNWFHGHRSLPPAPEQYAASLRLDLKKFQDAISMPAESTVTRPR